MSAESLMRAFAVCVCVMVAGSSTVILATSDVEAKGGGASPGVPLSYQPSFYDWSDYRSYTGAVELEPLFVNELDSVDAIIPDDAVNQGFWNPHKSGLVGEGEVAWRAFFGKVHNLQPHTLSGWYKIDARLIGVDEGDAMKSGIRWNLYDINGVLFDRVEYWFSSWSDGLNEMPVTDSAHQKAISGGLVALNEWRYFEVHPMADFSRTKWVDAYDTTMEIFTYYVSVGPSQRDEFSIRYDGIHFSQACSLATYQYSGLVNPGQQFTTTFEVPSTIVDLYAYMTPEDGRNLDLRLTSPSFGNTGGYVPGDTEIRQEIPYSSYSGRDRVTPEAVEVHYVSSGGEMWQLSVYNMDTATVRFTVFVDMFLKEGVLYDTGRTLRFGCGFDSVDVRLNQDYDLGKTFGYALSLWSGVGDRTGGDWYDEGSVVEIPYSTYGSTIPYYVDVQDYDALPGEVWDMGVFSTKGTVYYHMKVRVIDAGDLDPDGDGLTTMEEIHIHFTDPLNPDTDDDGLKDGEEVDFFFTDPKRFDTDGDGWGDGEEVHYYYTDPNLLDTDEDGVWDRRDVDPLHDLHLHVEIKKVEQMVPLEGGDLFDGEFKVVVKVQTSLHYYQEMETETRQEPEIQLCPPLNVLRAFDTILSFDVDDDATIAAVTINLWEMNGDQQNFLCDISPSASSSSVVLAFDFVENNWDGSSADPYSTGYVSGYDGNTQEKDCRLWFNMWVSDPDCDGITYYRELLHDLDPRLHSSGDFDDDGATNFEEWNYHSRADDPDTDDDGMKDGYEIRSHSLNNQFSYTYEGVLHPSYNYSLDPACKWDGKPFMNQIAKHTSNLTIMLDTYSNLMDWGTITSLWWDADYVAMLESQFQVNRYDFQEQLWDFFEDQTKMYLVEGCAQGGFNPLSAGLYFYGTLMQAIIYASLTTSWEEFDTHIAVWSSFLDTSPMTTLAVHSQGRSGAGYVHQIGYSQYEVDDSSYMPGTGNFDKIRDAALTIMDLLNSIEYASNFPNAALFHSDVLPAMESIMNEFGEIHDAGQTGLNCVIPRFDVNGAHLGTTVLIDSSDTSGLQYYSDLEAAMALFARTISQEWTNPDFYPGDPVFGFYDESETTTWDVALDLVSLAVEAFYLLKSMRWFSTALYYPSLN